MMHPTLTVSTTLRGAVRVLLVIPARPSAGRRHQDGFCLCYLTGLLHSGGPWALASALYWARCFGPCVARAPVHRRTSLSVTSHRFSPLQTAELPRNHYNSPSGFDPALRRYTSQGRTTRDVRLRSWGYRIILHFSFLFTFLQIYAFCLSRHHTPASNSSFSSSVPDLAK